MAKKEKKTELLLKEPEPNLALEALEKAFGKGTIIKASDRKHDEVKEWVSTGSLSLDIAIGGFGVPKNGKCTCILGKEGSSKTTMALHIIAEDQKKGNICCFMDVEDSIDLEYAQAIGVNLEKLHLIDRISLLKSLGVKDREVVAGEEWLELLCKILKSNIYGTVVFDSIAALFPMSEMAQGLQGGKLASIASMMTKAYRAVNSALTVYDGAFVYLNQYRMNPGGYIPLVEPGGEAWKYLQSLKIEISKSLDKDADGAYGIIVNGKITKSKVCIPFKRFKYYVEFGVGIVRMHDVMNYAIDLGFVKKSGSWYSYEDMKLGQGEDGVLKLLNDNPEVAKELEIKIIERLKTIQLIEEKEEE